MLMENKGGGIKQHTKMSQLPVHALVYVNFKYRARLAVNGLAYEALSV